MTTRLSEIIERLLVGAIALTLALPLPLAVVRNNQKHFQKIPILRHPWLSNRTLRGMTVAPPDVHFSWRALARGDFQRSKAARLNEQFAGREALIRWTSEVWFRLFRETASPTSTLAVGVNGVLFETAYLREYYLDRTPKEKLLPWVRDLRRLQDFCRKSGTGFLVVISPSKVSLYPEDAPRAWRHRYDPRPRGYELLLELFRENNIVFLDAHAFLQAENTAHPPPVPFYPKGGIHWNARAVWLVVNAIQEHLRAQGQPVEPLTLVGSSVSNQPVGSDQDLALLMNLACPLLYPCEQVSIQRTERSKEAQLTMAVVGGSFSWELANLLSASGQFSEVTNHFYYRLYKTRVVDGKVTPVRSPGVPEDFAREIFGADCLLLELNEASAPTADNHVAAFLRDALAHLPDHASPRPPFKSD